MKINDFRDLTDSISDAIASVKSAATPDERAIEAERLGRLTDELESALGETKLKPGHRDAVRAARLLIAARGLVVECLSVHKEPV